MSFSSAYIVMPRDRTLPADAGGRKYGVAAASLNGCNPSHHADLASDLGLDHKDFTLVRFDSGQRLDIDSMSHNEERTWALPSPDDVAGFGGEGSMVSLERCPVAESARHHYPAHP